MKPTRLTAWALLGLFLLVPGWASAQAPVSAELLSESRVLSPGEHWLAVRLSPQAGWHTYWRNPGDSGQATTLSWTVPTGVEAGEIQWPRPRAFPAGSLTTLGYDTPTLHLVRLHVPASRRGQTLPVSVQVRWLACADACIPGRANLSLELPVAGAAELDPTLAGPFAEARAQLPEALERPVSYRVDGDAVQVSVPGDLSGEAPDVLRLYAEDEGLLPLRPPQVSRLEGQIVLRWTRAKEAPALAPEWNAVLLAGDAAWRVHVNAAGDQVVAPTDHATTGADAVGAATPQAPASTAASADGTGYLGILLLAFLGGLVLNLMPCVFPVLSMKAVSLMTGGDAQAHRQHALAYTAGAVLSCVAAAAALLVMRAGGQALGWGFQLQSPFFVGLMAYLMFVMALSLSGALHIGTQLMGVGQSMAARQGLAGSFFTGVLAVVVASPCTAPFMGTAMGYAMTQPWPLALGVFACLGLGLASPFLLFALVPAAIRLLPRPGAWMETFKQAMAFPLYFSVVWLLWVLGRQAGLASLVGAMAGLVLVALAVWSRQGATRLRRSLAPLAIVAALGLIGWTPSSPGSAASGHPTDPATGDLVWQPYSEARLAELRAAHRAVFVDLTADWCLTCKFNERTALDVDRTRAAFARHHVALLRGDWTRADPEITAALARQGRNGVPLYLFYPSDGRAPRVLPQMLTPGIVERALEPSAG